MYLLCYSAKMATQISEHSADTVAHAFVDQYYRILHMLIDQSYRFYKDESVLSWARPDGELKSATTTDVSIMTKRLSVFAMKLCYCLRDAN